MISHSFITFPIFENFPELLCTFTTRIGGYSQGLFSTMNMGLTTNDNNDIVKKNREKLFDMLKIDQNNLAIPQQIHSANVQNIQKAGIYEKTDALITNNSDIILTIQTADCLPVFIYDPISKIIGVVHAGWQGSLKGIIKQTMEKMSIEYDLNYSALKIAVGPGIQSSCFEIREDVYSKFSQKYLNDHKDNKKRYLNLQEFIKDQLLEYGILLKNIYIDSTCTHCDVTRFYSYRRDKNHSGRMMGIISFKNALYN